MFLKAVVVTLALVAITGTRAEVDADQVSTVMWQLFTQLSDNAKEAMEQVQKSDITQQLKKTGACAIRGRDVEMSGDPPSTCKNLRPCATERHTVAQRDPELGEGRELKSKMNERLTKDAVRVKEEIQKELEDLRARMMPHANTVSQTIGDNMQKLQQHLKPYAEGLQTKVNTQAQELKRQLTPYMQRMQTTVQENMDNLQASMMPYANEFKDKFNQNVEELKGRLTPRASELKATIDQNLEDLRRSLAPLAEGVQEKLNHQLEGLAFQMKKNAEELQTKVSANVDQLQKKLAPLVEDVHSKLRGNTEGLQKSLEDLNSQLDQQVEEFRRTVEPLGEMFNKALVQQMEQFRQQLGSNSGDVQGHLSFLEKSLREKVSSFMGTLGKKESPDQPLALPLPEQVQEQVQPNPPNPVES
ncbi:apolipoprotein A-IV-like protein [Cricetulus griseus]|uniref:Apolipoprotein A-IV n=1 Tax=Cricetulus griseus TaxID=10029 RepID=A0A061I462_CRIGR|nr:apolipoprotein A-IV-like protein [Cricetulus griseus]